MKFHPFLSALLALTLLFVLPMNIAYAQTATTTVEKVVVEVVSAAAPNVIWLMIPNTPKEKIGVNGLYNGALASWLGVGNDGLAVKMQRGKDILTVYRGQDIMSYRVELTGKTPTYTKGVKMDWKSQMVRAQVHWRSSIDRRIYIDVYYLRQSGYHYEVAIGPTHLAQSTR
jgi:hypothetical protein